MNLSQLSHLDLGSMLPGHRIKYHGLIKCDKFYLVTDVNEKFTMLISLMLLSPYKKSRINSISAQRCFGIIFSHS
jgi:hypothetical protein